MASWCRWRQAPGGPGPARGPNPELLGRRVFLSPDRSSAPRTCPRRKEAWSHNGRPPLRTPAHPCCPPTATAAIDGPQARAPMGAGQPVAFSDRAPASTEQLVASTPAADQGGAAVGRRRNPRAPTGPAPRPESAWCGRMGEAAGPPPAPLPSPIGRAGPHAGLLCRPAAGESRSGRGSAPRTTGEGVGPGPAGTPSEGAAPALHGGRKRTPDAAACVVQGRCCGGGSPPHPAGTAPPQPADPARRVGPPHRSQSTPLCPQGGGHPAPSRRAETGVLMRLRNRGRQLQTQGNRGAGALPWEGWGRPQTPAGCRVLRCGAPGPGGVRTGLASP
ncbi:uncharacterized protein AAES06_019209 [Glossophaga mutica]